LGRPERRAGPDRVDASSYDDDHCRSARYDADAERVERDARGIGRRGRAAHSDRVPAVAGVLALIVGGRTLGR
jgi:hypothetical protein